MKRQFLPILLAAFLAASGVQAQPSAKGPEWLSRAIFYQIYPSSFQDSDGNGIGDMPGIISRLDYIQSLGVNALWLNPVYESGWFDGGYDIIDFYRIAPRFGTNSDMVRLIDEAHKRGLRVCLDLVAGHTSDRCRWFVESATADPRSLLHYVRHLLRLRRDVPALGNEAGWTLLSDKMRPYPMVYRRSTAGDVCIVAVNPSAASVSASIPTLSAPVEAIAQSGKVKYKRGATTDRIVMGPVSAVVYRLSRP